MCPNRCLRFWGVLVGNHCLNRQMVSSRFGSLNPVSLWVAKMPIGGLIPSLPIGGLNAYWWLNSQFAYWWLIGGLNGLDTSLLVAWTMVSPTHKFLAYWWLNQCMLPVS